MHKKANGGPDLSPRGIGGRGPACGACLRSVFDRIGSRQPPARTGPGCEFRKCSASTSWNSSARPRRIGASSIRTMAILPDGDQERDFPKSQASRWSPLLWFPVGRGVPLWGLRRFTLPSRCWSERTSVVCSAHCVCRGCQVQQFPEESLAIGRIVSFP